MADLPETPHIDYPTRWQYKLVGRDRETLQAAVRAVIGEREFTLELSNQSRKGTFLSMNLEVTVETDAERVGFYAALGNAEGVLYVL